MWNITNRWRWSVWACQNKTRQWDQLWTTKCGEEDKEEGESWTSGVPQPGKRSVWGWFDVTTEWEICVISNNTNTIIIICTERWVFQTFPTISTKAWLRRKFNSHFLIMYMLYISSPVNILHVLCGGYT